MSDKNIINLGTNDNRLATMRGNEESIEELCELLDEAGYVEGDDGCTNGGYTVNWGRTDGTVKWRSLEPFTNWVEAGDGHCIIVVGEGRWARGTSLNKAYLAWRKSYGSMPSSPDDHPHVGYIVAPAGAWLNGMGQVRWEPGHEEDCKVCTSAFATFELNL